MNEKKNVIIDDIMNNITEENDCVNEDRTLKCDTCNYSKECDIEIDKEYNYNNNYNHIFAELIDCGGYDSLEEYWNELFE